MRNAAFIAAVVLVLPLLAAATYTYNVEVSGTGGIFTGDDVTFANIVGDSVTADYLSCPEIRGGIIYLFMQSGSDKDSIDVAGKGYVWMSANSDSTRYRKITGGKVGQIIVLEGQAGSTALSSVLPDSGMFKLSGSDWTGTTDETLSLIYDGSNWVEVARSDN